MQDTVTCSISQDDPWRKDCCNYEHVSVDQEGYMESNRLFVVHEVVTHARFGQVSKTLLIPAKPASLFAVAFQVSKRSEPRVAPPFASIKLATGLRRGTPPAQ